MGGDGGTGTKGPVVCTVVLNIYSPVVVLKGHSLTGSSKSYRVILVLKAQVAILDPLAHQDLKEALVSLVSKDNW